MQRLSTALRIGKSLPLPAPTLSCFASHFIIDLHDWTPPHHLIGWKRIEVELPLSGQAEHMTYRISKSIPLSFKQLDYLKVGFRLAGRPGPYDSTFISISYGKKGQTNSAQQTDYWTPNPLGSSDPPCVYISLFTGFYHHLEPGILIHSSLTTSQWPEPRQVVVEWKRGA
ncbi:hypothetical protein M407DRAFT_245484 [Tulasnella calospora MUT 4182]|uniref:Uncharacterized protein n=1 Tax=Tulasnella calospora MUT 4182 TaxID=1051891 RepID=A0A0C3Q0B6_9AGAM|nr:hypothetical protein M407DRAFT_245484 [Tulasnella calospora MUT 4182]